MTKWREIRRSIRKVASKAVSKTGDITDTASLHVKLARKEALLADLYEQFGRVQYQVVKTGTSLEHKTKVLIEKIDIVRAEIIAINDAIAAKRIARETEIATAREVEKAVEKAEHEAKNIPDED